MCRRVQDPASIQLVSSCQASQQAPEGISGDTRSVKDMLLTDRESLKTARPDEPICTAWIDDKKFYDSMPQFLELYRIDRTLEAFILNIMSCGRLTSGPLHKPPSRAANTEVMLCPHFWSP